MARGLLGSRRLILARRLVLTGCRVLPGGLILSGCIAAWAGGIAIRLTLTVIPSRAVAARIVPSRTAIAARIPRTVAPHIAIAVAVSAIPVAIPIPAAAIAVMADIAILRPIALRLGGCTRSFCALARGSVAEQPAPKSDQSPHLRGFRLLRLCGDRFRNRHGYDGRGGGGQDAGHQRHIARRLLVPITDVRVIHGRLVSHLVADGGVLRQFLFVVADPAQGIGRGLHVRIRHYHQ